MAKVILHHGCAPEGISSSQCTATLAQVLEGATALTSDSNDIPGTGTLQKVKVLSSGGGTITEQTDSGNTSLTSNGATKSFAAGYYANQHGAVVSLTYADW